MDCICRCESRWACVAMGVGWKVGRSKVESNSQKAGCAVSSSTVMPTSPVSMSGSS